MKKILKTTIFLVGISLIIILMTIIIINISLSEYQIDKNKLVDVNHSTIFLDANDEELFSLSADVNTTKISEISDNLKNALISIEDKRFYSHQVVDEKA